MRVLLAAPASGPAGGICRWTNHIRAYYNALADKQVSLDIYDLARSEFIPDDISLIPRLRLALKDYRAILRGFKSALSCNKYDVVHITSSAGLGLVRDLLMIRMAHKKGIKSIVHFRFGRIPQLFEQKNWEFHLLSKVVRKVDKVIVIDKNSYETLKKNGYTNIDLLPNPLAPGVMQTISKIGAINRESRMLLFVGHCIATKGVLELVQACRGISNIRLRLIGAIPNDVREQLLEISYHEDWLEIMGEQPYDEVIHHMLSCDIFVLPTYTEGFPNVILEAMACGCAIVSTPVGAIPEMLEVENDKQYGLLVPPKSIEPLRDAILTFLNNPQLSDNCGRNARERVNERYTMDAIWGKMVEIWKNA
ncbi:MAG: glycosyltransferase family 4 protein [Bacteroidaceae bacterium]|nr:glycosyltransferase family 4 protein [Bacteroidaceae bacterium]